MKKVFPEPNRALTRYTFERNFGKTEARKVKLGAPLTCIHTCRGNNEPVEEISVQTIHETHSRAHSMLRRLWLGSLSVSLAAVMALTFTSTAFSQVLTEPEETFSIVVWYLENGYWRDDVHAWLVHAQFLFYPMTRSNNGYN